MNVVEYGLIVKIRKIVRKGKNYNKFNTYKKNFYNKKDGTDKAQNNKKEKESLIGKIFEIFWGD